MTESYYTRHTPDYSPLVVHFTKDRTMIMDNLIKDDHPLDDFKSKGAFDRLLNILQTRVIFASPMPWIPKHLPAVCFTECIWDGLIDLSDSFSTYGVVFRKDIIFDKGGGPAIYLRGDLLTQVEATLPIELWPFVTPFDPEAVLKKGTPIDFVHEREWRLPQNFEFAYEDVRYVIVDSLADARRMTDEIGKDCLPEQKVILMEVYNAIREGWRGL